MRKSLSKQKRIKRRKDIERVFTRGLRVKHGGMKIFYVENSLHINRIIVTAVKQVKKAVRRNRQKRLAREAYRNNQYSLKQGYDIAIVLYPGDYTYTERETQLISSLRKANLIEDR